MSPREALQTFANLATELMELCVIEADVSNETFATLGAEFQVRTRDIASDVPGSNDWAVLGLLASMVAVQAKVVMRTLPLEEPRLRVVDDDPTKVEVP